MKRSLLLTMILAVAMAASAACKKAEEKPAPAGQTAPAADSKAVPGDAPSPAQPSPAPDRPET